MYLLTNLSFPLNKDHHKWINHWLSSDEYKFAALCITTLQIIVMPILLTLHAYRLRKYNTHQDPLDRLKIRYTIIDHVSLAAIAFSFVSGIITISNYTALFDEHTCRTMTVIQNVFWLLTKVSIYIVVLLRLQCAFWGSSFEINHRFNHVCYALIALFVFVLCVGTALPYPIGVESIHLSGSNFCLLIIPPWLILTPLIFDILCSIVSLYLFINPIQRIMEFSTSNAEELSKLLTKYILISAIAIFSNLFSSIWFTITDILIFTYFDVFINPICLILMQIQHDDIYFFLCKHCHRGVEKMLTFPVDVTNKPNNHAHQLAKVSTLSKVSSVPALSPVSKASDTHVDPVIPHVPTLCFEVPNSP
eukprot:126772_1